MARWSPHGGLEIGLGARGPHLRRTGARLACKGDQRNRTFACGDRFGRVPEMDDVGAAAGIRAVDMSNLQAEIIDHRPGAAGRVAGKEVAVDIVLAEPRILDGPFGDLGVELGGGFVRRMPGRVFIDPGNVGLA